MILMATILKARMEVKWHFGYAIQIENQKNKRMNLKRYSLYSISKVIK